MPADPIPPFSAPPRRSGFLQRPDCRIYHEVSGDAPGDALVFLHGLGGNHLSWWQQVAHFAPRHTCVAWAHRGFAPSSALPAGPDPADYPDDLLALLDELGLARVWLVGQSMGGWTALEFALRHPERVRGLVMCNTTGTLDPMQLPEPVRSRVAAWSPQAQAAALAGLQRGIHPAGGERMAREQPALHLLYRHIDDIAGATLDKQALMARLFHARSRPPADLARLRCPVLFIVGQEDIVIPPFAIDAIAAQVPGAQVARIERAGHSAYFERPAEFNAALGAFLGAA